MTYGLKEAHDELLSELEDLREKYDEVCETSAMLRADMAAARERQTKLRDENAKLRELVDELWSLSYGYAPVESELDDARDMMRELGIEVDA